MGLMDLFTNSDVSLSDKDIAYDMLKDSKFAMSGLTLALSESTNPQLRQMLSTQLNNCIANHHKLSDIAVSKNWYKAYADPSSQIESDYQDSLNTVR